MCSSLPPQSPDIEGEEAVSVRSLALSGSHIYLVVSVISSGAEQRRSQVFSVLWIMELY